MKPLGNQLIAEFVNCDTDVLNNSAHLERLLVDGIKQSGLTLINIMSHQFHPIGVTVVAIIGESHVMVHTYPEARHASLDIFTCSAGSHAREALLDFFKRELKPGTVRLLDVGRGNPLHVNEEGWMSSFSSIGYETSYHIQEHVLSKRSQFQQIDVIENEHFGRMLFLDKDLQIAERDAGVYNDALVSPLVEAGRPLDHVLILGGGDGGVLSEVLRHDPARVTLVDIDGEVIETAKRHLRGICGDAFERSNVEVRVEDANVYLEQAPQVDAVIYDLTMFPEALTRGDRRTFLAEIFGKIARCLKPGSMMTMQCCSQFDTDTLVLLSEILAGEFEGFEHENTFIPSFCESWVFGRARARAARTAAVDHAQAATV